MRLSMVSPGFPPDKTGGIENYIQLIFQELSARGHQVDVITTFNRKALGNPHIQQVSSGPGELRGYTGWAAKSWLKLRGMDPDVVHFNGFPGQILSVAPLP